MWCARWSERSCCSSTTAWRMQAIRQAFFSADSTASTPLAAYPIHPRTTAANMDSSLIDPAPRETTMPTVCTMIGARRRGIAAPALRAALVAAGALLTCACNTTQQVAGVPEEPTDYRMRHPIVIREADRTLQMFIGSNRSELTPSQRAELLAFAQSWRREATGGVVIDLPVGASNERAAADALREIQSIVVASGVA